MGVPPPAYESQSNTNAFPQDHQLPQVSHPQQTQAPYVEQTPAVQSPQTVYSVQPDVSYATGNPQDQKSQHNTMAHNQGFTGQQQMGVAQPHPIPLASLMTQPSWVQCPSCTQVQMTRIEFVAGGTTHLWAAALCCCLCLGCIPYCVSSLKDVEHHCGSCGTLLAVHKRSGTTMVHAGAGVGQSVKH